MAGVSNKTKTKTKHFSYDIVFDGALLSSTRGTLIVELIKYILYERQQIPMPADELKDLVSHQEDFHVANEEDGSIRLKQSSKSHRFGLFRSRNVDKELESHVICKSSEEPEVALSDLTNTTARGYSDTTDVKATGSKSVIGHNISAPRLIQDRKAKVLVNDLTKLFQSLEKAFELCPEIEQVAVLLGGTVVSPKESYFISFPPPCPEADSLPLLSCKRALFQQLISEDILGTMNADISPTTMTVLASAPRSCPLAGFLPKQFMHRPKTGAVISLHLHCNYHVPICHDLTIGDGDFELSGIVPLDFSDKDNPTLSGKKLHVENGENGVDLLVARKFDGSLSCKCEFQIRSRFSKQSVFSEDQTLLKTGVLSQNLSHSDTSSRLCQLHRRSFTCQDKESQDVQEKCLNASLPTLSACSAGEGDLRNSLTKQGAVLKQICQLSPSPVVKSDKLDARREWNHINTDYIWYQSQFVIKGYRNKVLCHNQLKYP